MYSNYTIIMYCCMILLRFKYQCDHIGYGTGSHDHSGPNTCYCHYCVLYQVSGETTPTNIMLYTHVYMTHVYGLHSCIYMYMYVYMYICDRNRRKGRVGHPSVSVRVDDERVQLINETDDDTELQESPPITQGKKGKGSKYNVMLCRL